MIKARIKAKGPQYPAQELLVLKITEVCYSTPGPDTGNKGEQFFCTGSSA